MEIVDIPAQKKLATIQVAAEDKTVAFDSLIVLNRKNQLNSYIRWSDVMDLDNEEILVLVDNSSIETPIIFL